MKAASLRRGDTNVPCPGDVLHLGRSASVQFDGTRAIVVEVLRVVHRPLFEGWLWLEVLVLHPPVPEDEMLREVFVQRRAVGRALGAPPVGGY